MAKTYTAKGTAVAKASGTTLESGSISIDSGATIVVGIAFDSSQGNPTITFGKRELEFVEVHNLTGWRVRQYSARIKNENARTVKCTWDTAIGARVMTICQITEASLPNVQLSNDNLAGTISTTGINKPVTNINTLHMHHHATIGPSGDAIGVASANDTLGQRVGTTGDADTTNITLQESYEIQTSATIAAGSFTIAQTYEIKTIGTTDFTAIGAASNTVGVQFAATGIGSGTGDAYELGNMRGRITGLTTRDHMAVGVAYEPLQTYTLTRNFHQPWNSDWDANHITMVCEDEAGVEAFHVRVPLSVFNNATDADIVQYVKEAAVISGTNTFGGGFAVEDENTVAVARADTFINDKFTV